MGRKALVALSVLVVVSTQAACSSAQEREARFFSRAAEYFDQGKYREAAVELKNVLEINPRNAQARLKLGLSYIQMGGRTNLQLAYTELVKALDVDPDLAEARLRLAWLLLAGGEPAKAREHAERVLQARPDDLEAHLTLARGYVQEKNLDAAEAELERILAIDPGRLTTYYDLGAVQLARKDWKRAGETLRKALALDPSNADTHLAYARYHEATGAPGEAEASYRKAIDLAPEKTPLQVLLARHYLQRGEVAKAEAELVQASQLDPKDPVPYVLLGDLYRQQKRLADAERAYRQATTAKPEATAAWAKLAELHLKQGKQAEAAQAIDAILSRNARDLTGLLLKSELLLVQKKPNEALPILQKVSRDDASLPQAHYLLALAYLAEGDEAVAKSELSRALDLRPTYPDARLVLAQLHLRSQSYDLVLEETGKVLKVDPGNVQALLLQGEAYLRKNDLARSKAAFEQVVSAAANSPVGYVRLGIVEARLGHEKPAKTHLERALALDPNSAEALLQLTGLSMRARQPQEAIRRVEAQISVSPKNPVFYNVLGYLHEVGKDAAQAELAYRKAIDADPNGLDGYMNLGRLYINQKKFQDAIDELENAKRVRSGYLAPYMLLGVIYDQQGHRDKARAEYEQALRIDPTFGPAANNLAWIYSESGGNLDQALFLAETARQRLPDDPSVADTLGWIYYKRQVYSRALSLLKEGAEKLPRNAVVRYHLGMAYLKSGEGEMARKELTQALALDGTFAGAEEARGALKDL